MVREGVSLPAQDDSADRPLLPSEAAVMLDVPLDEVLRLLDCGALPSIGQDRAVGIPAAALRAYIRARRAEQRIALRELTRISEEFGLYSDEYGSESG